jgi:hypothetical protein
MSLGEHIEMPPVHSVKVRIKCPSSKVTFGNNDHFFSSRFDYIITVSVPLLTGV